MLSILLIIYLAIGIELAGIFLLYDGLTMGFNAFTASLTYVLFWPILIARRVYRHLKHNRE